LGNPFNLMLTPGQDHDLTCAQPLLKNADLIADKAYDADPLIDALGERRITEKFVGTGWGVWNRRSGDGSGFGHGLLVGSV